MKEFKLNEKTYSIPEKWNEVKVKDYKVIMSTINEGLTNEDSNLQIVADIVCNLFFIPKKDIYSMEISEFNKIVEALSFSSEKIQTEQKDIIEWEDKKYKIKSDFTKLSLGEQLSIETLLTKSENVMIDLDKVTSVLLREIKEDGSLENFNADKIDEYIKMINEWPITNIYDSALFFSSGE